MLLAPAGLFFFSSRRRHTRWNCDWSSDVCLPIWRDVTQRVRETDVTEGASRVSVHPKVREWMVLRQREMGTGGGVVMEGRDIATKVFPDADVKVFLDADPVVREQRRLQQQHLRGVAAESPVELRERDRRDRTRTASPLAPAPDSLILDSTRLSEDQ